MPINESRPKNYDDIQCVQPPVVKEKGIGLADLLGPSGFLLSSPIQVVL